MNKSKSNLTDIPQYIGAEYAVLGAIVTDNKSYFRIIDQICEEDFHDRTNSIMFGAIKELILEKRGIDYITIREKIESKYPNETIEKETVEKLCNVYSNYKISEDMEVWAKLIKEKSDLRKIIYICENLKSHCFEKRAKPDSLINQSLRDLINLHDSRNKNKSITLEDGIKLSIKDLEKKALNPERFGGINTGFFDLDEIMWGLHKSELTFLAGDPSSGKTSLLLNIMTNVASKGKKVLFFSLEMKKNLIVNRILSSKTLIDGKEFRKGISKADSKKYQKLLEAEKDYGKLPIIIDDGCSDIDTIFSESYRHKVLNEIDLICIDYFNLIDFDNVKYKMNDTGIEAKKSKMLKKLSNDLDLPVICISARRKEDAGVKKEKKKPTIGDLLGSCRLGFDADNILFLINKNKDFQELKDEISFPYGENIENDRAIDEVEVLLLKSRNGMTGRISLSFLKEYYLFEDRRK